MPFTRLIRDRGLFLQATSSRVFAWMMIATTSMFDFETAATSGRTEAELVMETEGRAESSGCETTSDICDGYGTTWQ
jgi:hypothetical protein